VSLADYRLKHILSNGLSRWQPFLILFVALALGIAVAQLPLRWALGLLVFGTFVVLSIIQPLIPLGAALIAGPFGAYENVFLGDLILESGQLLFLLAIASWAGNRLIYRPGRIPKPPLLIPLIVLIAVSAVTLLTAGSFEAGIKELAKWIEICIAMVVVFDLAFYQKRSQERTNFGDSAWSNLRRERWFIIMLLVAGLIQALIGIWQFAFQESGPDHFVLLERFYRAYGTFMQPNPFGGFMGITASLAIGTLVGTVLYLVINRGKNQKPDFRDAGWLLFLAIAAIVSVAALAFSWSRGAWLGFTLGMIVMTLFLPIRRRYGLFLLGAGFILFMVALRMQWIPPSIMERVTGAGESLVIEDVRGLNIDEQNYAVIERLAHWQAAIGMASDNLWLGVGFGNYENAYPDYELLNWPFPLGHAHNYYLNVLAETGVVGLLAYLVFWAIVFYQLLKLLRMNGWPRRGVALGLLAAWTAVSMHHLVDKLYVNNMYIFMGIMLGLQQILVLDNDSSNS
jgi:putative inorganic carbon (HCO3(-)) transporter